MPRTATRSIRATLGLRHHDVRSVAQFIDDATTARAQYRSARGGSGNLAFTVGEDAARCAGAYRAQRTVDVVAAGGYAVAAAAAALAGDRRGDRRPRAHRRHRARARLSNIVLDGGITGDDIRIDLPRYGVLLNAGRLRTRSQRQVAARRIFHRGGGGARSARRAHWPRRRRAVRRRRSPGRPSSSGSSAGRTCA